MQSPEGQSREKDERSPYSVIPKATGRRALLGISGLVNIYLHIIRICLQKYKIILYFCRQIRIIAKEMKKTAFLLVIAAVLCACSGKNSQSRASVDMASNDSIVTIDVKYATGFSVRDSADVRLVNVGKSDCFALVQSDDVSVPNDYTKIRVPIKNTICMTALQL